MSEPSLEDLYQQKDEIRLLLDSSGWGVYASWLKEQIKIREQRELSYDIENTADAYEMVRMKAERRALALALELPKTFLEQIQEEIDDAAGGSDN